VTRILPGAPNASLNVKLENLAATIADEASLPATGLRDRIDALKALTPYYVNTAKLAPPRDDGEADDPDGGFTFERIQQRIASSSGSA
jgi:hypothetical protein